MASRRASFRQADATRALKAAVAAGLRPTGYRLDPTGAIEVQFDGQARSSAANSFDDIQRL
jgi:hypothetical protein